MLTVATMRTLLLLLASVFASVARAEVVVYKGTGTCRQPNDVSQFGTNPRLYYIVDLSAHTSYPIFYFTLNGQKKSQGSFPLSPTYYNAAPGFKGKISGAFNFVFDIGSVTNPSTLLFYFRGKAVTVATNSNGGTGVFPETMTGIFRGISYNNGNPFNDEINFVVNYDSFHTQAANNALKSGATVYSDILAELSAKGYQ
jgi:hypothetical protein